MCIVLPDVVCSSDIAFHMAITCVPQVRIIKSVCAYKSHVTSPFQAFDHDPPEYWEVVTQRQRDLYKFDHPTFEIRTFLASSGKWG